VIGPAAGNHKLYDTVTSVAIFCYYAQASESGVYDPRRWPSRLENEGVMTKISARLISNIPWGGVANQGQHVLFDLHFQDGGPDRYACPISTMPLLVGNLTQYAGMAEAVRTKGADRAVIEAAPYRATEVVRSGHGLDGSFVTIEYNTTHGFPVSIALTLEQAQQTIEFLQREMLLATQLPDQDQRHFALPCSVSPRNDDACLKPGSQHPARSSGELARCSSHSASDIGRSEIR
jgi:hypothetical protein